MRQATNYRFTFASMAFAIIVTFLAFTEGALAQTDYVKRINCGAPDGNTVSFNGENFESDLTATGFTTTADLKHNTLNFAGVAEPLKSFTYTQNPTMEYSFAVANGTYDVKLHFVEPYHGPASGSDGSTRVFDVDVEGGQYIADDLNVWSAAGSVTGGLYTIDTRITVNDGSLTLLFSEVQNDPIICAIEVLGVDTADTVPPGAPTLSGTGNTDTTAGLAWSGATDNVGVTGYRVYKDGSLEASLGNVGSYQVSGLTASTAYAFTVRAIDAAGNESTLSNSVSVTTDSSPGGGSGTSVWSEAGSTASYTGSIAVGTSTVPSGYQMAIDGKLITEEVKVQMSGAWPDYVFAKDYDLPTLEEIQAHITEKGHLPNIPSAEEVETNGLELGEMNKLLLEKIEELTLHLIIKDRELKNYKQQQQYLIVSQGKLEKRIEELEQQKLH
ncbi:MAG: malectin domain-containing carbohydrate-binding protein [Bacteroidota bacterium]